MTTPAGYQRATSSSPSTDRPVPASRQWLGRVAAELGVGYLDTGAMYRALTWWCLARGGRPRRPGGGRGDDDDVPLEVGTDPDASEGAGRRPRRSTDAIRETRISLGRLEPSRPTSRCARVCGCASGRSSPSRSSGPAGAWPRAATSPRWWRRTPTCACCSPPARTPGWRRRTLELHGGTDADSLAATRDQIVRRDRGRLDGVAVRQAADGVVTVDTSDLDFDQSVEAVLDVVRREAPDKVPA